MRPTASTPLSSPHQPRSNAARLALSALLLWSLSSCLDPLEPNRIVTGTITDKQGAPLADAVVSVDADTFTTTDATGAFELLAPLTDARSMLTVTASSHTAWSLDTNTLTRFTARLPPLTTPASPTGEIKLNLTEVTSSVTPRQAYLSLDSGLVLPFEFTPEAASVLTTTAPAGTRLLTLLSPGATEDLWLPPLDVIVETDFETSLRVELEPVQTARITLKLAQAEAWPAMAEATFSILCASDTGATALASRHEATLSPEILLKAFPTPAAQQCTLYINLSVPGEKGASEFVSFQTIPASALTDGYELTVGLGSSYELLPVSDGKRHLSWPVVEGASLYDAYIAELDNSDGGLVNATLWSCSSEQNTITLPALPERARAALALDPDKRYALRIVARFAPGLDIEDNWDWSSYSGYLASPWVKLPESVLEHWRSPP